MLIKRIMITTRRLCKSNLHMKIQMRFCVMTLMTKMKRPLTSKMMMKRALSKRQIRLKRLRCPVCKSLRQSQRMTSRCLTTSSIVSSRLSRRICYPCFVVTSKRSFKHLSRKIERRCSSICSWRREEAFSTKWLRILTTTLSPSCATSCFKYKWGQSLANQTRRTRIFSKP